MNLSISFKKCAIYSLLPILASFVAIAGEVDKEREIFLSHIEQLTFPLMGFEKAGEAYFSPDSQKICFQAVLMGEENYKIFTLDLCTRELLKISGDAETCTCSFFSPDGKKIIFAASPIVSLPSPQGKYKWDFTPFMNIYESNLDGSEAIRLTHGPAYHAECAYSSDGSQIVYSSNEGGSMNIYTMNRDGSNVRQVTFTTNGYNGGPFFSPDDSKIIFRADRETPDLLQIYTMKADGSELEQLTHNSSVNWAPFWHPSGKAFAYTTSIHGHHQYEIYLMDIANLRNYRITNHCGFDGLPAFNADGSKILWTSKRGDDNTCQIFMADFNMIDF